MVKLEITAVPEGLLHNSFCNCSAVGVPEAQISSTQGPPEATEINIHNLPEHWVDKKHEPDGTSFCHLDVPEAASDQDITKLKNIIKGPIQFSTGANVGAATNV